MAFGSRKDMLSLQDAKDTVGNCYLKGNGLMKRLKDVIAKQRFFPAFLRKILHKKSNFCGEVPKSKDEIIGFEHFRLSEEKNSAPAQYSLGCCYFFGKGVEEDQKKGWEYFQLSAENGNPYAQNIIGMCYEDKRMISSAFLNYADERRFQCADGYKFYQFGDGKTEKDASSFDRWFNGRMVIPNAEKSFNYYQLAAKQGHADAQDNLGLCYYYGKGVTQNYEEAVNCYHLAAKQGHPNAQNSLGYCYENGIGVVTNLAEAFNYYEIATTQRHAIAACNLGDCYRLAIGITQNHEKSFFSYQLSSDLGYCKGQTSLGQCYWNGRGIAQSFPKAYTYYQLAAEQGYDYAQVYVGHCYELGRGVRKNEVEAFKFYELATHQGNDYGRYYLGHCYENGIGVAKDYEKAFQYYQLSAQYDRDAQYRVGVCYKRGMGVKQNHIEALKYFNLAVLPPIVGPALGQGHSTDCQILSQHTVFLIEVAESLKCTLLPKELLELMMMYIDGVKQFGDQLYEQRKYEEAIKYYECAAREEDADAMFSLGICYENAHGVEQSDGNAAKYYQASSKLGHSMAISSLAECYLCGWGVERDQGEALNLLLEVEAKGNHHVSSLSSLLRLVLLFIEASYNEQYHDADISDCLHQLGTHYASQNEAHKALKYYTLEEHVSSRSAKDVIRRMENRAN